MARIEVTDEGLVRAAPAVVYGAVLELMSGRSSWWAPHVVVRAVGEGVPGQVGSKAQIHVSGKAHFVALIEELEAPSHLQVRYIDGDFRGEGRWTFAPEQRATRVRFSWQATPARWWLRALSGLVRRNHSQVMRLGFAALDRHLHGQTSSDSARTISS